MFLGLLPLLTPAEPPKLVSIVWDGAADWAVDRLIEEGRVPNVAKMKRTGASAESVVVAWPSKTAVGHAALFTGVGGDLNGITNNAVPMHPFDQNTVLQSRRGFDANAITAEPVWVTAANSGKKVVALSAAVSYPPSVYAPMLKRNAYFKEFSGFESELAKRQMIRNQEKLTSFEVKVGDTPVKVELVDLDRRPGFDRIKLQVGNKVETVVPSKSSPNLKDWVGPFEVQKSGDTGLVYFRLWSLQDDGTMELYQRSVNAMKGTETPEENLEYLKAYGGFHDDAWFDYGDGLLGKPLWKEGKGEAEERMLEIVRLDCEFLSRSFKFAWKKYKPDIVFHYTPMSDSAGHTLMGVLAPRGQLSDTPVAKQLWEFYAQCYELQDRWLGEILKTVDRNTIVSLTSDHGMEGSDSYVYVNKALEDAGLLAYNADGSIDLTRTSILVPSWTDFFLVVNSTNRKGGIVGPERKEAVIREAIKALANLKDPNTGEPLIRIIARPGEFGMFGIGGLNGGDIYIDPAPGLYPSNRRSQVVTSKMSGIGQGTHGFMPARRSMHAIFYAVGPGVPNKNLGQVQQTNLMGWLSERVGFEFPPKN